MSQKTRTYLWYCSLCFLFGKCKGPEIVKDPEKHLLGDWEGVEETSCRKFHGQKPAGELIVKHGKGGNR